MIEEALEVATEPDYRFELAIQLGKLDIAKVITAALFKLELSTYLLSILNCALLSFLFCILKCYFPITECFLLFLCLGNCLSSTE